MSGNARPLADWSPSGGATARAIQDIGEMDLAFTFDLLFSPIAEDEKHRPAGRPAGPLQTVATRKFVLRTAGDARSPMSFSEYLCVGWDTINFAELDAMVHTAFTGGCRRAPPVPDTARGVGRDARRD